MKTNVTVVGGEISVQSAFILPSPLSSITMAVGGSVTLTRATPLPNEITRNLILKDTIISWTVSIIIISF